MDFVAKIKISGLYVGLPGIKYEELNCTTHGIIEDAKHYGPTLISGPRKRQGTVVHVDIGEIDFNWRQFSMISVEEVNFIKEKYVEKYNKDFNGFDGRYLGANIEISGFSNCSKLPIGSIVDFSDGPLLSVLSETTACNNPGKYISEKFNLTNESILDFKDFSLNHRGCCGMVLHHGKLRIGQTGKIYKPT